MTDNFNNKAEQFMDDTAITAKIKGEYLINDKVKSFDIHVETNNGVVTLTGTVDNQANKSEVEQIARNIKGVKSVNSQITHEDY